MARSGDCAIRARRCGRKCGQELLRRKLSRNFNGGWRTGQQRWGFGAPKATPAAIVDKLNRETNAALADPRIKARLSELGGTVLAGSPADFAKLIAEETEKLGKVIRAANIKPD